MILNTLSLCNNITSRANLDIKDAHSPKKEEKKEKKSPRRKIQRLTTVKAPPVVTTPRFRKRFSKTTPS
jgi:hypothetical protein